MTAANAILNDAPEVTMKLSVARDGSEQEIFELIAEALDEAQAPVFAEEMPFNYVIIKIVK